MGSRRDHDHSTLEPVTNQLFTHRDPLSDNPGMQVVCDNGKQVNFQKTALEVVVQDQGSHQLLPNSDAQSDVSPPLTPPQRRRKWLLYGGIAAIFIVVAAVLGGVFGSRTNKKSSPESNGTSSTSTSLDAASPFPTSSGIATGQSQRKLAAVSYAQNSVDNTRIYFQDNAGEIVEVANSAKDKSTWTNIKLGFFPKNGSAIGAAVSRPGFTHEITLLYIDTNDLIHDVIYHSQTDRWTEGDLSRQKLIASSNASLSALYWQCARCTNTTIIAYQDVNNFVQIGNRTSAGWVFTQIGLNPIQNTGLALHSAYIGGVSDQINFYYQKATLNLSQACWFPARDDNSVSTWFPDTATYTVAPPRTPIAVAASYSNSSSGYDTWVELLSLSSTGIQVGAWSGQAVKWLVLDNRPSPMTNSTANPKVYGALAVTATGRAFAVVSTTTEDQRQNDRIESWRVADDFISWTATGVVDVGGAWG